MPGPSLADTPAFSCKACDRKAAAVKKCRDIDPGEYSTGLLFNPPGKKTYFARSSCLQEAARKFRDPTLCEEVRERESLFFDGSAISRESCERRVQEAMLQAPDVVIRDPYRLAAVEYFRNGNGRDIDVDIAFSGTYRHRYALTVSMVDEAGATSERLHHREYSLGPATRGLRIWLQEAQVAAAAEALSLEPPYRLRVSLALVEPSLAELEQFAAMSSAERESVVEHRIDPAVLVRDLADIP
jgi:hypothetical protein